MDLAVTVVARSSRRSVRSTRDALIVLRRRGVPADVAAGAIARCQALGLLDDGACARLWADHWAEQGYAWAAIHEKLAAKGLDAKVIEEADRRLRLSSGDAARARAMANAVVRPRSRPPQRARAARVLASKGFDAELIEQVLEDAFGPTPSHAEW